MVEFREQILYLVEDDFSIDYNFHVNHDREVERVVQQFQQN